jgi:putative membrane protein
MAQAASGDAAFFSRGMMRILIWLLRAVLFLVLLGFAVKNSSVVTMRFFFDSAWQLPLVAIMLIFFAAGAVVGVTAILATFLRQRREIVRLKRELQAGAVRPQ